ncbi:MAG: hypothetical protein RLZ12_939 [Bacillota bacterium]|jgi:hypothetical protein
MSLAVFKTGDIWPNSTTEFAGWFTLTGRETKTIFTSCCGASDQAILARCSSFCRLKIYCGLLALTLEEADGPIECRIRFFYNGQPIRLDCTQNNLSVLPAQAKIVTLSMPFDKIEFYSYIPATKDTPTTVKGRYHITVAVGTS